eukprot:360000-Chlamydomonas_euryale.AAC.2
MAELAAATTTRLLSGLQQTASSKSQRFAPVAVPRRSGGGRQAEKRRAEQGGGGSASSPQPSSPLPCCSAGGPTILTVSSAISESTCRCSSMMATLVSSGDTANTAAKQYVHLRSWYVCAWACIQPRIHEALSRRALHARMESSSSRPQDTWRDPAVARHAALRGFHAVHRADLRVRLTSSSHIASFG